MKAGARAFRFILIGSLERYDSPKGLMLYNSFYYQSARKQQFSERTYILLAFNFFPPRDLRAPAADRREI